MVYNKKEYETNLKFIQVATGILCISGLILSIYAYHVETKKEEDENYTAMCDISEHMSCTAAFSSKYGKGFGLLQHVLGENSILVQPNSVYGIMFYLGFIPISEVRNLTVSRLIILVACISNACSVYLAYILMFILYDFCVVCVTTYLLNALLLICSIFRYRYHVIYLERNSSKKKK
ncbi:vitamin K epoxide reductase complex subunit 1 [Parasteatoda tepidariorum]|uniref:vitamin K epoxide reductase complex subunit 1 n=1 Tax=Parasteatoda tepidariorum TaxID=114398 RepID=UPI00077FC623|nr:vitamin K epoxide reductase complex subunit 1 [Parasteatoda tepidariorum]